MPVRYGIWVYGIMMIIYNESSSVLRLVSKHVEWYEQGAEAAMYRIDQCTMVYGEYMRLRIGPTRFEFQFDQRPRHS